MGVITKSDVVICKGNSVESLHVVSTEQSEDEQESHSELPVVSPDSRCRVRALPTSFANVRKRLGKKKSRRYQDAKELMTLVEEDDFGEVSFEDLVPNTETNFSVLFRDGSSMLLWRVFLGSSEEVQEHFMKGDNEKVTSSPMKPPGRALTGDEAYRQIEGGLRSILRKTKPCLELLNYLEQMLVDFFTQSPRGKFVSGNMTSFERLLCHAISQYHVLSAQSFNVEEPEPGRAIRIKNKRSYFTVPEILLGEYLGAKRQ